MSMEMTRRKITSPLKSSQRKGARCPEDVEEAWDEIWRRHRKGLAQEEIPERMWYIYGEGAEIAEKLRKKIAVEY